MTNNLELFKRTLKTWGKTYILQIFIFTDHIFLIELRISCSSTLDVKILFLDFRHGYYNKLTFLLFF